jgi:ribosomal protein S18 acetylase RimI-like enzyme
VASADRLHHAFALLHARGQAVRFHAAGRSMWPLLRPGDVAEFTPLCGAPPKIGDIVLYRIGERLIVHRVIGRDASGRLRLRGDFTLSEDAPIAPETVLGRLAAIERAGRRVALGTPARALALLLPPLERGLPGALDRVRRSLVAGVHAVDAAYTAGPVRRLRRALAGAMPAIAIAQPSDRPAVESFDRRRGRDPYQYLSLLEAPADAPRFCVIARARPGGDVVAATHVLEPEWAVRAGLPGPFIHDTYVLHHVRGLGLGRAVSAQAIVELARRGVTSVMVAVALGNRRSRKLYQQLGFVRARELPGYFVYQLALARAPR